MKAEDPKTIFAALESKLADARQRHDATQSAAREIAFGAYTGDDAARERLDKLNDDAAKLTAEIASLEAAVETAKKNVLAAAAAERDVAECANAERALELLDDFARRGAELDEALDGFVGRYQALERDFRQLSALGFQPAGSWELIKVNMALAVGTRMQMLGLQQRFLAPDQRRDFVTVISGWASNVRARATARINRNKPGKAA